MTLNEILKGFGNWTLDQHEPLTAYKGVPMLDLEEAKQAIREAIDKAFKRVDKYMSEDGLHEMLYDEILKELGLDHE